MAETLNTEYDIRPNRSGPQLVTSDYNAFIEAVKKSSEAKGLSQVLEHVNLTDALAIWNKYLGEQGTLATFYDQQLEFDEAKRKQIAGARSNLHGPTSLWTEYMDESPARTGYDLISAFLKGVNDGRHGKDTGDRYSQGYGH